MLTHDDYQIGWMCAIFSEMAAARSMLDAIHPDLPNRRDDRNSYLLGNIGPHNIAIACLPAGVYGTTSATSVAIQMRSSFRRIRFCLMVGVGGGAPRPGIDIRLGDVVVSQPTPGYGGVIPYDHGKAVTESQLVPTGTLNKPPEVLLIAVSRLRATHALEESRIQTFYNEAIERYPRWGEIARYPGKDEDKLFMPEYSHTGSETDCEQCDGSRVHQRPSRSENQTRIFYGLIASANQIMRNAGKRDKLARDYGILCFEMEAAGLMDIFPCLIIRGICDYSDSHKNKQWQGYAAMTAAAYAKELLLTIPCHEVESTLTTFELPVRGPGYDHNIDQEMPESQAKFPPFPRTTPTNIDRGTLRISQTIPQPAAGYSTAGDSRMLTLLDSNDALADIVFIHGSTGNPETTLMKEGVLWPQIILPDALHGDQRKYRIFSFGYHVTLRSLLETNTSELLRTYGNALAANIAVLRRNIASDTRPIILVAHDIGGSVCQQMLASCRASRDVHVRNIYDSTYGVIFMGPLHPGKNRMEWELTLNQLCNLAEGKPLRIPLESTIDVLVGLEDDFHTTLSSPITRPTPRKIFSFYKEKEISGAAKTIPRDFGCISEKSDVPIYNDHVSMARSSTSSDTGFNAFHSVLSRWMDDIGQTISNPELSSDLVTDEISLGQKQPQSSLDIVKEMDIPNPDMLACLSSKIDSKNSLLRCLSLARRQRSWDPWPGDCAKIFYTLEIWLSKSDSALLVLVSDPRAQSRTKDLAAEVANLLDESKAETGGDGHAVIWTFSSTGVTDPNNDNPTEILKSLIYGAILGYPRIIEPEVSTNPSFGEEELWKLLKSALSKTKRVFVIIEANDPKLTARMLQLADELVDTPGSMVKFLLVVYPGNSGSKTISHISPNERKQVVRVSLPPPLSRKLHYHPRRHFRLNDLVPRF